MSNERKGVEFFVGLFLVIGFGVIATMIVVFGRVGEGMKKTYSIYVRFPNASGLVKGANVLISGARVGIVSEPPRLTGQSYEVVVGLKVREGVRIPRTSVFQIRSSGMLGDSYVDIVPPAQYGPQDFAVAEETIAGQRAGGLDDLTAKGSQMIDTVNREVLTKAAAALDEITMTTASLRSNLLSEKNLKNVEATFTNLKTTTDEFAKITRDLDLMVHRTQAVVDSAQGTMKTLDGAAADLRLTLGDFRKTSDSATKLFNKASAGEGALGTLISDKQTAEDLRVFIANLRRSGVLWYKNRPVVEEPPIPKPKPTPRRR